VSLIRSAAMLLDWHGARSGRRDLVAAARAIDDAVGAVIADPATRTRDLGGTLTTDEIADAIASAVRHSEHAQTTETTSPARDPREDSHA
jgi:3-isopropylmalate dehydrogenase